MDKVTFTYRNKQVTLENVSDITFDGDDIVVWKLDGLQYRFSRCDVLNLNIKKGGSKTEMLESMNE